MKPPVKTLAGIALAGVLLAQSPARAHDDGETKLSPGVQAQIAEVRRATARFHDFNFAIHPNGGGYGGLVTDLAGKTCIDQPGQGAMGVHYVNGSLFSAHLDPLKPQALIYEPLANGTMRLVGVEYIVLKTVWDGAFAGTSPRLFGRNFHLVPAGNRYGLPDFYELHLWLWQPNRSGMFNDWNPAVRCP
ncbi:MAG: hypothetical protein V4792_13825 [Pseudomonadota bacterium]